MSNLLTYIDEVKDLSFYDQEAGPVDFLALTEIAYLPYDQILTDQFDSRDCLTLNQLAQAYFDHYGDRLVSTIVTKNRLKLLKQMSESKRFRHIKAFAYVNDYSLDLQKQFAALIFRFKQGEFLLVFRGTDDSLIGWKEDFHMTYMKEIPSQLAAQSYLTQALERLDGHISLSGHSKGGNLALFAASQLPTSLQDRIVSLTTYDSPGLHRDLITSKGYQAIRQRISAFIPQDSVVGMMLDTPEETKVIYSRALGLLQHDTFSWEIKENRFVPRQAVSLSSRQTDQTLTSWTSQLSEQELKDFFDSFFGLFLTIGVERLGDLHDNTPQKIKALHRAFHQLPEEEKTLLLKFSRRLFDTYFQVIRDSLRPPQLPLPQLSKFSFLPAKIKAGKKESDSPQTLNGQKKADSRSAPSRSD